MTILDYYSNKEISFRFNGKSLSFFLSQSLFSSFDIDEGTKLLLKTLSKNSMVKPGSSILDMGCGTGVLGLSLKKTITECAVTLQDRDALASYFTQLNAEKNEISDVEIHTSLAFAVPSDKKYDLIVSNLPAKAGIPVLKHMIREMLFHLAGQGTGAVVIVSPLRDQMEKILDGLPAAVTHREDTKDYSVFHFTKTEGAGPLPKAEDAPLVPYIRRTASYTIGISTYPLTTVYGLPDFDTPPYDTVLNASALTRRKPEGNVFIWNPGQGHSAALLVSHTGTEISTLTFASRDVLQCEISAYNIEELKPPIIIHTECYPAPLSALWEEQKKNRFYSWMLFSLSEPVEKKMIPAILSEAQKILLPEGFLVFTGKSAHLSLLSKEHPKYTVIFSRKYRGFRILMLQKRK